MSEQNRADERVVRQLGPYGCGAACAEMLLADRGIPVDQLVVASGLHQPARPRELAERLNALSRGQYRWHGGYLDLDPPLTREIVEAIGRFGSWAALFLHARELVGHWVVVDGIARGEQVPIRDPRGARYHLDLTDFERRLRHFVVVFERGYVA